MTEPSGYFRLHHCRGCGEETRQIRAGHENTTKPLVEYWRCAVCSMQLITYQDVADVEGLCEHLADRWLASQSIHEYGDVRSVDRADLHSAMMEAAWELYVEFTGGSFLGYASTYLVRRGAVEWIRQWRGRTSPKALAVALSLDAKSSPFVSGRRDDMGVVRRSASADAYDRFGDLDDGGDSTLGGDRLGSLATEGPGSVRHDCDAALRRAYAEGSRLGAVRRGDPSAERNSGVDREVGVGRDELPAPVGDGASG